MLLVAILLAHAADPVIVGVGAVIPDLIQIEQPHLVTPQQLVKESPIFLSLPQFLRYVALQAYSTLEQSLLLGVVFGLGDAEH